MKPLDADARFAKHHRLAAVRGHLYEKLGDLTTACDHYRAAAGRTTSTPERDYLLTEAARCRARVGQMALHDAEKASTL